MKKKNIYDISRSIDKYTAIWPGDSGYTLRHTKAFSRHDGVNVTKMTMGMHMATHVDAPLHYIKEGKSINEMDLTYFLGEAKVFEIDSKELITLTDVKDLDIESGDIVLLKTSNSLIEDNLPFFEDYVAISIEAANHLVKIGIKTVGIDYLSVESYFSEDSLVHKHFLENDIVILEGLNLKEVTAGKYFISCLPLKLVGTEASPVRAVLIEI